MKIKITKKIVVNTIIALIIIAIGLFCINQFLDYQFKAQLLSNPCQLCMNQGNRCEKIIPIDWTNITFENQTIQINPAEFKAIG